MSERWLQTPNLPKKKITLAAISEKAHSVRRALVAFDIRCMPVPCCRDLAGPVASHADMLLHHLENEHFLMAQENRRLLKRMEREKGVVRLLSRKLAPFYPHDILLNVFRLGQHCFGLATCAAEIRSFCEENNLMFHLVKQGYAKCSTVLVNEQACITADVSIAAAVKQCGLDVLQIRPGFVELPGYHYGFLGGASGKLSSDVLAFAGNLDTHPDAKEIRAFLLNHHVSVLSLQKGPLLDLGGILPLREEA